MDFSQVLKNMHNGDAAKTPRMHGYVKREDYENNSENAALFAEGAKAVFDLVFVPNPQANSAAVEVRLRAREDEGRFGDTLITLVDGELVVDPFLMTQVISSDWEIYRTLDLERNLATLGSARW